MPSRRTTTLLRVGLVVLGALALVLLVLALALPPLARMKTREVLDGMDGARGDFQDVQVTLFPLRYTITRLKITQNEAVVKQPFFYAERLEVTLRAAEPPQRSVPGNRGRETGSRSSSSSRSPAATDACLRSRR